MDDDIGDVSRQAGPRSELINNPPAGGLLGGTDNFLSFTKRITESIATK